MANNQATITQLMGSEQAALDLYMNIMASYMLLSVANDYMNDATEMLEKRGLKTQQTKFLFNNAQKWMKQYDEHLQKLLPSKGLAYAFMDDFDELRKVVDCFILGHSEVKEVGQQETEGGDDAVQD